VVFRREDRWTGDVRYVYHGNDGTSMPWNDTAQLDYLKAEVREAVIQTILAVARKFPIIRFDAAMTLAKKHVARLWFPEPGQGGAIPSRAESALSKADFDAAMPEEFWREVVDRVATEVPETLLLAEAFWMMEGYFVRTLGMHRVYNSAFMHMLRDEKNAEYRILVKNTLEFDPEILKRYVNFMNNPDEKTAIEQFGTGDKYFGIATVMATMPGLPMVGHGQVEGYAEKYGMEFRRAYWDERPNDGLVARHEWQLFPLLHRRRLFAEVRDFRFYDVFDDAGHVNEDVLAYSNRSGGERSLVIYHNRYASMRGRVRDSVAYVVKDDAGAKHLVRSSLADGLGLTTDPGAVVVFRDTLDGLEYIREVGDLRDRGLRVELEAYAARVLLDWREIAGEAAADYRALAGDLGGAGVPSVEGALAERRLRPLHDAVAILVNDALVRDVTEALAAHLAAAARAASAAGAPEAVPPAGAGQAAADAREAAPGTGGARGPAEVGTAAGGATAGGAATAGTPGTPPPPPDLDALVGSWRTRAGDALRAVRAVQGPAVPDADVDRLAEQFAGRLRAALDAALAAPASGPADDPSRAYVAAALPADAATWGALLGWIAAEAIGGVLEPDPASLHSRGWFDRAHLGRVFADAFRWRGLDEGAAWWTVETVRHLIARPGAAALAAPPAERPGRLVRAWFADAELARWLGVNRHEGVAYVNRESFEAALRWTVVVVSVTAAGDEPGGADAASARAAAHALAQRLAGDAMAAGYEVGRIIERATA
jgi:hypothetical protein